MTRVMSKVVPGLSLKGTQVGVFRGTERSNRTVSMFDGQ